MNNKNVTIYVSDGCNKCNDLLAQLDEWNVFYQIKNISKQREHLYELQKLGIYGTPATFIEGEYRAILGFQK
ncbi:glutaredoxin family protein, partial [Virgibacillus alimentarius]